MPKFNKTRVYATDDRSGPEAHEAGAALSYSNVSTHSGEAASVGGATPSRSCLELNGVVWVYADVVERTIFSEGSTNIPSLGLHAFGDELYIEGDCIFADGLSLSSWEPIQASASTSSLTARTSGKAQVFTRTIEGKGATISILGAKTWNYNKAITSYLFRGDLRISCEEFGSLNPLQIELPPE